MSEVKEISRRQRIDAGRWLRVDESKIETASDQMLVRRVLAAARDRAEAFDEMLGERDVNRLFNAGAMYFEPPTS